MDELISNLQNLSLGDSKAHLKKFVKEYEKSSSPPELREDAKAILWDVLFRHVDEDESVRLLCLKAVRILSRDKINLQNYVTDERLKKIIEISGVTGDSDCKDDCRFEAIKCLCNITYNISSISEKLNSLEFTFSLVQKLVEGRTDSHDRKLIEIKLLFVITAYSESARHIFYDKYDLSLFTNLCLEEGKIPKDNLFSSKRKKISLGKDQLRFLSETLKTVFNVLCSLKYGNSNKDHLFEFVSVLRELILIGYSPSTDSLLRDIVNVLTLIPLECLESLTVPGYKWLEKNVSKCPSMEAVAVLIDFLDATLVKIEEVVGTPKEELSPILLVLTNIAKSSKQYRKFIRSRVLPNLKEIYTRPEVGNTLRNKLCRLLTCPLTSTRDLVADFLFVLCKESVGRMVKYTGYGNAAGLFANRGLLGGDPRQRTSSESEDSETEEYSQNKHMINPIVGCLTPPRTNETQNMTEEQKEYLAMELVNKIDKLHREGVIKPCRIGPDGKPQPVEHILELQDANSFVKRPDAESED